MGDDENDQASAHKRTDLERPFQASESPAVPLRSGTVLAGRYEIGKAIGQGGMGLVVQAFDRTLGVEVAIKIVRSEYAGEREWSERLAREVKLARQIQADRPAQSPPARRASARSRPAALRRGRHPHRPAHRLPAGPGRLCGGVSGPVARRQTPRLQRPHRGRPGLCLRFRSPGRSRRHCGGADCGAVEDVRSEVVNFHLPVPAVDIQSPGGDSYYLTTPYGSEDALAQVDPAENLGRFVGVIRGQRLLYPLFLDRDLVFVSNARVVNLVRRSGGGEVRLRIGADINWASKCGERIIATQATNGTQRTVWLDSDGRIDGTLADGTVCPRCSSDGRTMFWTTVGKTPAIQRCDGTSCRTLFNGEAQVLSLSPDDRRLAFLTEQNRGHVIRWVATDGRGGGREVTVVDTGCTPVWSNEKDLWVALRNGRHVVWTEFDSDSAKPTGRTSEGTRDCTDAIDDPAAPGQEAVKIDFASKSQVRVLSAKDLPRR